MAATQTLPQVVSFPQSVPAEQIRQADLVDLIEARNTLDKLKRHIDGLESSVQTRLESGAQVEPGVHVAELKESFRRNVAWKAVVVRLATRLKMDGDSYCSKVLAATKPSRIVSLDVH